MPPLPWVDTRLVLFVGQAGDQRQVGHGGVLLHSREVAASVRRRSASRDMAA